jgi:hypothetical protein
MSNEDEHRLGVGASGASVLRVQVGVLSVQVGVGVEGAGAICLVTMSLTVMWHWVHCQQKE